MKKADWLALKVPPLVQVVVVALGMLFLARISPVLDWPPRALITGLLLISGSLVALLGVLAFHSAKTTVNPRNPHKTVSLVTTGIYRISRNPMYLGFAFVLASWAVWLGSPLALLLLPLFVFYMNRYQIGPEEQHMTGLFGSEYQAYCRKVRRWI